MEVSKGFMKPAVEQIIEEYGPEYCQLLASSYDAEGMMSEGGIDAVLQMFDGIPLNEQRILEIGSGLGTAAIALGNRYPVSIQGIEINPWLIEQAQRRTPIALSDRVQFGGYDPEPCQLGFAEHQFDLAFSKLVLLHLQDKSELWAELFRCLKPGGWLLIDDWVSPVYGQWGPALQKLCELEDLTIYAESQASYRDGLAAAGFESICLTDESPRYAQYLQRIIEKMTSSAQADSFRQQFGDAAWRDAVEGYELIRHSLEEQSLFIQHIRAQKP